ncbi:MAG: hypothetical protein JSV04_10410 [Candidatus Heimdallarchaeota archaeon]|nr:MAG: hypothetical protein JSV04_10410 [Candidatus Heimdallarchaeota archaeon]
MQDSDLSFWFRCYSHILAVVNQLGSLKWLFPFLFLLHFLIGAFIPPLVTSDFQRNLFYGDAFWKHGFTVYDMTPLEISNNTYNVRDPLTGEYSYPNTTYDYPTVQLLFWAGLSLLPFSSIISKWFLSCIDILNFFLIYSLIWRRQNEENKRLLFENGFALSYLLFAIPFSAIEGQPTAITVLFLLMPLLLHTKYPIWSYMSIGFGFHWKYVSLLLLPYLLLIDHKLLKQAVSGVLVTTTVIVLLSFPFLFSDFILNYFAAFGALGSYSGQTPSNPLFFFYPSISSILSSVILITAVLYWIGLIPSNETSIKKIIEQSYWMPFVFFLGFLKIYTTAFPWYWMWFFPPLALLPQNNRKLFVVFLGITFAIGLLDFIQMTVGLTDFVNFFL